MGLGCGTQLRLRLPEVADEHVYGLALLLPCVCVPQYYGDGGIGMPMTAAGGAILGMGMAIGGCCPGTVRESSSFPPSGLITSLQAPTVENFSLTCLNCDRCPRALQLWVQIGAGSWYSLVALASGMAASLLYAVLKTPLIDNLSAVGQVIETVSVSVWESY